MKLKKHFLFISLLLFLVGEFSNCQNLTTNSDPNNSEILDLFVSKFSKLDLKELDDNEFERIKFYYEILNYNVIIKDRNIPKEDVQKKINTLKNPLKRAIAYETLDFRENSKENFILALQKKDINEVELEYCLEKIYFIIHEVDSSNYLNKLGLALKDVYSKFPNSYNLNVIYSNYNLMLNKSYLALKYFLSASELEFIYNTYYTFDISISDYASEKNNFIYLLNSLNALEKERLISLINSSNKKGSLHFEILSWYQLQNKNYEDAFKNHLYKFTIIDSHPNLFNTYSIESCYNGLDKYLNHLDSKNANTIIESIINANEIDNEYLYNLKFKINFCMHNYGEDMASAFVKASLNSSIFFNNNEHDFSSIINKFNNKVFLKKELSKLINAEYVNQLELSNLFIKNGSYETAFNLIENEVNNLDEDDSFSLFNNPFEYIQSIPNSTLAITYIERLETIMPQNKTTFINFVTTYIAYKKYRKAADIFEKYVDYCVKENISKINEYSKNEEEIVEVSSLKIYFYPINNIEFTKENKLLITRLYSKLLNKYPNLDELKKNSEEFSLKVKYLNNIEILLKKANLFQKEEPLTIISDDDYFEILFNQKPKEIILDLLLEFCSYYNFLYSNNGSSIEKSLQYLNHYKVKFSKKKKAKFIDLLLNQNKDDRLNLERIVFFKQAIFQPSIEKKLINNKINTALNKPVNEARIDFENLSKQYNYSEEVWLVLAKFYLKNNLPTNASGALRKLKAINPYNADYLYLQTSIYYKYLIDKTEQKDVPYSKRGYYQNFIEFLEKALQRNSKLLSQYDFSKIINADKTTHEIVAKYTN